MSHPDWSMDAGFRSNSDSPLGFGPFGERPPLPANDQGSSLARAVSEDLEAIFAPIPPAEATETPRRSARVRTLAGESPTAAAARTSKWAGMGAVAAALLAGLVLGSILLKPHRAPAPPPPPPMAASAPATPSAADLPAPPTIVQAPAAQPQAKATTHIQPKITVRRPAASRAAVMAADTRLRRAYASAVRAGVPRPVLVAARDRWSATRRADPQRLIATYGALAGDLERRAAARHGRRR